MLQINILFHSRAVVSRTRANNRFSLFVVSGSTLLQTKRSRNNTSFVLPLSLFLSVFSCIYISLKTTTTQIKCAVLANDNTFRCWKYERFQRSAFERIDLSLPFATGYIIVFLYKYWGHAITVRSMHTRCKNTFHSGKRIHVDSRKYNWCTG